VICFCTGGYREVAKEVEDPVDLEKLVVSPAPAGGEKKIDVCYYGCLVPAKMNSCHERNARSDYTARDCNDDDGFGRA